MTTKLLKKAIKEGCKTARDLEVWIKLESSS